MKRKTFTFTSRYKRDLKTVPVLLKKKTRARLRQYLKKVGNGSSLVRIGAAACLAIAFGLPALAQPSCNTFQNADAANPIIKQLHSRESIDGLDFVDIDGDGDLDCYVKIWEPIYGNYHFPVLFRNKGTAALPVFVRDEDSSGFQNTTNLVYSYSDIQFADLDGDGDFDCFIAESYTYFGTTIHYFENKGTKETPVFVSNEAGNPLGGFYSFYGIGFTLASTLR